MFIPPQLQNELTGRLLRAGLRPTTKRLQLAAVLFDGCDKHFTAEDAHRMVLSTGVRMSQATVYNTLNQFAAAGLLNRIAFDNKRAFFDTNVGDHHHVFYDDDNRLADIPASSVQVTGGPVLKDGEVIRRVDLVLRVSRSGK